MSDTQRTNKLSPRDTVRFRCPMCHAGTLDCSREEQADQFLHLAERFLLRDQVPLLLGNGEPDQFGIRPLKIGVCLSFGRL